jgi:type IV pilus assembly protein PilA
MKRLNNKAFSLVEMIIVVAIMAVLVGVMAPQYVKYLNKTQKKKDCAALNTIMDVCENMALDPDSVWTSGEGDTITITVSSSGCDYTDAGDGDAANELKEYVAEENVSLSASDWGPFTIEAVRDDKGRVEFSIADDDKDALAVYSDALSNRFE